MGEVLIASRFPREPGIIVNGSNVSKLRVERAGNSVDGCVLPPDTRGHLSVGSFLVYWVEWKRTW